MFLLQLVHVIGVPPNSNVISLPYNRIRQNRSKSFLEIASGRIGDGGRKLSNPKYASQQP
jgi:hypothetical protein